VGIAAGILSGLFGVGGGVVIVPSLISVYAYSGFDSPYNMHIAIATSLFTIIFTSISSAYKHSKNDNVLWVAAAVIGIASSVTVFLFSKIALGLPGDVLEKIFAFILVVIGMKMLFERKKKQEVDENNGDEFKINNLHCIPIGILTGMIAAFTGLGGGVFVIPLMHYVLKTPIRKSIGTSTAAIFITSVSGVLGYVVNMPSAANTTAYSLGMVDVLSALPIVAMSIPFAQVGVWINKKTHHDLLTRLFGVFVLIVSLRMIFS
jgi:uncharacterized membrane protein YfcA